MSIVIIIVELHAVYSPGHHDSQHTHYTPSSNFVKAAQAAKLHEEYNLWTNSRPFFFLAPAVRLQAN